jgi:hypothetical protein
MTTLILKDIPVAKELDQEGMATVRGGQGLPGWAPLFGLPAQDFKNFSFDAAQLVGQSQNVLNNNGNNAAFIGDLGKMFGPPPTPETGKNDIKLGHLA